jgi:NO-binding membrane sensor protein with MHYT domain
MTETVKVYNPLMIFVTLSIAFVGSYACIVLGEQYRLCSKRQQAKILQPPLSLLLMALALGGVGIWAMHFIGMSGVDFHTNDHLHAKIVIRYRTDLTVASFFVVIVVCGIGLLISAREKSFIIDSHDVVDEFITETKKKSIAEIRKIDSKAAVIFKSLTTNIAPLLASGGTVAGGVCAMHYLGMKSMVFPGHLSFNPGVVASSVVIAVTASIAALWILFRFLAIYPELESLRIACAVVMALAVNGMHYTGMAAGNFIYDASKDVQVEGTLSSSATLMIGLVWTVAFIWIVFMLSMADLRAWYNHQTFLLREIDNRANFYKERACDEKFLLDYWTICEVDRSSNHSNDEKKKTITKKLLSGSHRSGESGGVTSLACGTGPGIARTHSRLLDMNELNSPALSTTSSTYTRLMWMMTSNKSPVTTAHGGEHVVKV